MNKNRVLRKTKEYLISIDDPEVDKKMKIMEEIVSQKTRKERMSLLYDYLCDYLDNIFYGRNICEFKCNTCIKKRLFAEKKNMKPTTNGCCYGTLKKRLCPNLGKDGRYTIRNVGCKLFTCYYLKGKGYHYRLEHIYLSKYTLSIFQKYYLANTFFVPKEKVLKGLLRRP